MRVCQADPDSAIEKTDPKTHKPNALITRTFRVKNHFKNDARKLLLDKDAKKKSVEGPQLRLLFLN